MDLRVAMPFVVCVLAPVVSIKVTEAMPAVSLLAIILLVAMPNIYAALQTSPEDVERQVMTNHFQSACTFGETFNLGPRALIEVLSTTVIVCFVFDHATLSRAAVLTFLVLIRFCEIVNNL